MPDLSQQIEDAANSPKSVTVDGNNVVRPDTRELIAADEYLARKAAANRRQLPTRFAKLRPDGTI